MIRSLLKRSALAFALFLTLLAPSFATQASAANGTSLGVWSGTCPTPTSKVTVTSSGWDPSFSVRVSFSPHSASPVDVTVPINTVATVPNPDQSVHRTFDVRVINAGGGVVQVLRDQSAAVTCLTGPNTTIAGTDCKSVHVTGANLSKTYYQSAVRVIDETGALVKEFLTQPLGTNASGDMTYQPSIDEVVAVPNGHTYSTIVGLYWNGSFFKQGYSPTVADLSAPCPPVVGAVAGELFLDENVNASLDGGESVPANADALVELVDAEGTVVAATRTDANGHYDFENIPAGDYTVQFTLSSGYTGTTPLSQAVTVVAGQTAVRNAGVRRLPSPTPTDTATPTPTATQTATATPSPSESSPTPTGTSSALPSETAVPSPSASTPDVSQSAGTGGAGVTSSPSTSSSVPAVSQTGSTGSSPAASPGGSASVQDRQNDSSHSGDSLVYTGARVVPAAIAALMCVALGLVLTMRRRRQD